MSRWFEDARKRVEREEQRQQQEEHEKLLRQQLEQQRQQKVCQKLHKIVKRIGARKRLEYINEKIWGGCGQIEPYQQAVPTTWSPPASPNDFWGGTTSFGYCVVGLRLYFEYEVLYVGYPSDHWGTRDYESKKGLMRRTETVAIHIQIVQSEDQGRRRLEFERWSVDISGRRIASFVPALDEAIYLFCRTAHSPSEKKAQQDRINQQLEEEYRKFRPPQ